MASAKDVVDHHLKCFGEGDLNGILSAYAPGAVLFTPEGPLRGATNYDTQSRGGRVGSKKEKRGAQ